MKRDIETIELTKYEADMIDSCLPWATHFMTRDQILEKFGVEMDTLRYLYSYTFLKQRSCSLEEAELYIKILEYVVAYETLETEFTTVLWFTREEAKLVIRTLKQRLKFVNNIKQYSWERPWYADYGTKEADKDLVISKLINSMGCQFETIRKRDKGEREEVVTIVVYLFNSHFPSEISIFENYNYLSRFDKNKHELLEPDYPELRTLVSVSRVDNIRDFEHIERAVSLHKISAGHI